jgi:hypothetical protein
MVLSARDISDNNELKRAKADMIDNFDPITRTELVERQFENEFGRAISICVAKFGVPESIMMMISGPNSTIESVITRMEAEHLHSALSNLLASPRVEHR